MAAQSVSEGDNRLGEDHLTNAQTAVPPLRVQKGPNGSSPTKNMAFIQNRPLSELSPMALRRNSPSFPRVCCFQVEVE